MVWKPKSSEAQISTLIPKSLLQNLHEERNKTGKSMRAIITERLEPGESPQLISSFKQYIAKSDHDFFHKQYTKPDYRQADLDFKESRRNIRDKIQKYLTEWGISSESLPTLNLKLQNWEWHERRRLYGEAEMEADRTDAESLPRMTNKMIDCIERNEIKLHFLQSHAETALKELNAELNTVKRNVKEGNNKT